MKRFKFSSLRRMLALLLCLATLLSLAVLPASAAKNTDVLEEGTYATSTTSTFAPGTRLFLETSSWNNDDPWYAAYFFGEKEVWIKMSELNAGILYGVTVPSGTWTGVIFCRMNPASSDFKWENVWNKTVDITSYTSPKNICKVTGWNDNGCPVTWDSFGSYYVAGEASLCGSHWDPGDSANKMTLNNDGKFTITYYNVPADTHELKVTDGSWGNSWGNGNSNYFLNLTQKSHVIIVFDQFSKTVTVNTFPVLSSGKTIYFDATLSKLSYVCSTGYNDWGSNTIPVAGGSVFCHYWSASTQDDVLMTLAESGNYKDVYKCVIPADATNVLFYSTTDGIIPGWNGGNSTGDQSLTENGVPNLKNPCFYADSSDNVIYSSSGRRAGYWGEAYKIRNAQAGKTGADVVDIEKVTKTEEASYYVDSTFYDWYTDYELNSGNRDTYDKGFGDDYSSHRNWVVFRHLNQALSDYYKSGSVAWPLYVGHFQPSEYGIAFEDIASTLDLYGWASSAENYAAYRKFIASNNSVMDAATNNTDMDKSPLAMQGLVYSKLSDSSNPKNRELLAKNGVAFPLFNQAFIKGENSKNTVLGEVYENVQFPMEVRDYYNNGVAYYVFNSYDTTLKMVKDSSGNYTMEKVMDTNERARYQNLDAGSNRKYADDNPVYGFFPFNSGATVGEASTYNYGFGARFDVDFKLTSTGKVPNKDGVDVPIVFEFSGDDDVWVFIDGQLVLDIGGAHSAVKGTIDFSTKTATVYGVKNNGTNNSASDKKETKFTLTGDNHTLTMFYMERGMAESNMELVFNIANSYPATLNVTKEVVDGADPNQVYTMYVTLKNAETHKMEPVSVGTKYTIGSNTYTVENAGQIPLKGGETATIVGISVEKYSSYTVEELGEHEVYYFDQIAGSTTVDASSSSATGTLQEATSYNVTVVNAEAEHTVVIDYGIPVSVTVENSNRAALYALCAPGETGWTTSTSTSSSDTTYNGSKYGDAKIENGKIVYTPSDMKMAGVDKIGYVIQYVRDDKTLYYNGTLTVVPAATIYYEDNFVTFNGNWGDKKVPSVTQAEDRPGTGNAYDANNVYGYDGVYSSSTTHSQGYARCTNVSAENGSNPPTATFTFTGTGFDLIGVTSNRTGFATCEVTNSKNETVRWAVDTYYGYSRSIDEEYPWIKETWTYNGTRWSVTTELVKTAETNSSIPEDPSNVTEVILYKENYTWTAETGEANPLYQIPVIKSPQLAYDTYTVVITPIYAPFFDHTNDSNNSYDFYIDAVRVYNPAKNMESYYRQDGEAWPQFIELRQQLLSVDASGNATGYVNGVSFIDGVATNGTISDYKAYGPNNEIYLNGGQAIAFAIDSQDQKIANVHVGVKTFNGAGELSVKTVNTSYTAKIATASHTDLYYSITDAYIPVEGSNISNVIVLTNEGTEPITLTTLKITYDPEDANAPEKQAKLVMSAPQMQAAENEIQRSMAPSIPATRPLNVHIAHNVSFESNLQLNYRIKQEDLAGYDLNSAYLVVEKDVYPSKGQPFVETYVLYPDLTSEADRVIFTLGGIQSVEMGSELRATLYIKDELGRRYTTDVNVYSILAYVQDCYAVYSYEEEPALYSLLIDTLNYGAAAQKYFNRRADSLVNAGMEAYQQYATKELSAELTAAYVELNRENQGLVSKVGFTVTFDERTAMNARMVLSGSAEEITSVRVTDEAGNILATLTEFAAVSNGKIQATYDGINATQMRKMYYFTAYAGEEPVSATVGYSIEAYAADCIGLGDPTLTELVTHCMYYGDSAENYFTQRGGESK